MNKLSGLLNTVFQKPQIWFSQMKLDADDKRSIYELSHDLLNATRPGSRNKSAKS